jgi:hypothetical protein
MQFRQWKRRDLAPFHLTEIHREPEVITLLGAAAAPLRCRLTTVGPFARDPRHAHRIDRARSLPARSPVSSRLLHATNAAFGKSI